MKAFAEPGPLLTMSKVVGVCTIVRPSPLGEDGGTSPVLVWGNGTYTTPEMYSLLLTHFASHGFVVVAANSTQAGDGTLMLGCLTYVLHEAETPGTALFGRVDRQHVGVSGHSQGGAGTIMAGRDERVTATAPIQPYILPIRQGTTFEPAAIGQQHGPMLLLSGGGDTVADRATHQRPVFDGLNTAVTWATLESGNHFLPMGNAGDYRGPLTAWFRAKLMGDPEAEAVFLPGCALCETPGWTVESR